MILPIHGFAMQPSHQNLDGPWRSLSLRSCALRSRSLLVIGLKTIGLSGLALLSYLGDHKQPIFSQDTSTAKNYPRKILYLTCDYIVTR